MTTSGETRPEHIPPITPGTPYFIRYDALAVSTLCNKGAAGDLIFTPGGIYFLAGHFYDFPKHIERTPGPRGPHTFIEAMHAAMFSEEAVEAGALAMLEGFRLLHWGMGPRELARRDAVEVRFYPREMLPEVPYEDNMLTLAGCEADVFRLRSYAEVKREDLRRTLERKEEIEQYFRDPAALFARLDCSEDTRGIHKPYPAPLTVLEALAGGEDPPEPRRLAEAAADDRYVDRFFKVMETADKALLNRVYRELHRLPQGLLESLEAKHREDACGGRWVLAVFGILLAVGAFLLLKGFLQDVGEISAVIHYGIGGGLAGVSLLFLLGVSGAVARSEMALARFRAARATSDSETGGAEDQG